MSSKFWEGGSNYNDRDENGHRQQNVYQTQKMKGGSAHERLPNISQTDPQRRYDHDMEDESNIRYNPSDHRGFQAINNESFSPVRRDLRDSDEKMSPTTV